MASLYIHIPYCRRVCGYCDFYRQVCRDAPPEYLDALRREMLHPVGFLDGQAIDTIYFGGGTPSLYSPLQLSSLIDFAGGLWRFGDDPEITLEVNPDDLDERFINELETSRFNRVSIGIQSFNDDILRFMNRRHDSRQAIGAVEAVRRAGIGNISIDLIYGIPGLPETEWKNTVRRAANLGVQHISAYHLTIEQGTAFGARAARGELVPVEETTSESEYLVLCEELADAGFLHYEISNFAAGEAYKSRHNGSYWNGTPYLGLGASAHSYDGNRVRRIVSPDARSYIQKAGTDEIYESETLTDDDLFNEYVMVSLRTSHGIDLAVVKERFAPSYYEHLAGASERFVADGFLEIRDNRVYIPAGHFLVSDAVIEGLFRV